MHGHDTTQEAAPTKAAESQMHRIRLDFVDVNDEPCCHEIENRPAAIGNAPYQRACKTMLEYEVDFNHRLTGITVYYGTWKKTARTEKIDRMTLHQRAGEEAIGRFTRREA